MAKTTSINLLRSTQTHYLDTLLKWALTTLRFLIILTETVALSAFVYRFSLDRKIIDLAGEIKNNRSIVALYTNEPRYRNLQERLDFTATLTSSTHDKTKLLQELVDAARGKVVFQSVSITEKIVTLDITTSSTNTLSAFLNEVKKNELVKSVTVDKVENKSESGVILVGIKAELRTTKEGLKNDTR